MKRWQTNLLVFSISGLFSIGLLEVALHFSASHQLHLAGVKEKGVTRQTAYTQSYFIPDAQLGYAPQPQATVESALIQEGEAVYEVTYRIDERGLRTTPGEPNSPMAFAFFGDDYTFGEGVEDNQTLPSAFSKALDLRYHVLNMGFHGYGPHQMLQALQSGRLTQEVSQPLAVVYYQAVPWHMQRSFGLSSWDLRGPHYVYDKERKELEFRGPFHSFLGAKIIDYGTRHLKSANFLREKLLAIRSKRKEAMLHNYLQIVKKAQQLTKTVYHAEFQVVLWDEPFEVGGENLTPDIIDFFEREDIDYLKVSDIFETTDFSGLLLADGHPLPQTHQKIARYLADEWQETL